MTGRGYGSEHRRPIWCGRCLDYVEQPLWQKHIERHVEAERTLRTVKA